MGEKSVYESYRNLRVNLAVTEKIRHVIQGY